MDGGDLPDQDHQTAERYVLRGHLAGLQGRLANPFWGLMGIWATVCGALASNRFPWDSKGLLTIALAILLVDVAWGSLWDLIVGTDWRGILAGRRSNSFSSELHLPFTQPGSAAQRLFRRACQFADWWRDAFWPSAGHVVLGIGAACVLTAVLTGLLPARVRALNFVFLVVVGLGWAAPRRRRKWPLAGQSLVQVGLGWLVGHSAFSALTWPSVLIAGSFVVAAWGGLVVNESRLGGIWLLNGGQVMAILLLVVLNQPLAAVVMGLLFFCQAALQPVLSFGAMPSRVVRRMWPWLMATMIVAAPAIP